MAGRASGRALWGGVAVAVAVAAAAAFAGGGAAALKAALLPDGEFEFGQGLHVVFGGNATAFMPARAGAERVVFDAAAGRYNFGRRRRPPLSGELHSLTAVQRYTQLKEWHWSGFSTEKFLFGVATLQFGYASHAVLYFYDVETGETEKLQLEVLLFGRALGASFATADGRPSTLLEGCTRWDRFGARIEKCAAGTAEAPVLRVAVDATFPSGRRLSADVSMALGADDTLSYVYPIGPHRPAIVSKAAAVQATGTVRMGDRVVEGPGLGMVDWTRSVAARHTRWYWTSFSFTDAATGTRVGVQLSSGVYEDEHGNGVENFVSLNGTVHPVDARASFRVPEKAVLAQREWRVAVSGGGVEVAYVFAPRDEVHGEFHLAVLDGDLHHLWGAVSGSVSVGGAVMQFDSVAAVIEDHYALW